MVGIVSNGESVCLITFLADFLPHGLQHLETEFFFLSHKFLGIVIAVSPAPLVFSLQKFLESLFLCLLPLPIGGDENGEQFLFSFLVHKFLVLPIRLGSNRASEGEVHRFLDHLAGHEVANHVRLVLELAAGGDDEILRLLVGVLGEVLLQSLASHPLPLVDGILPSLPLVVNVENAMRHLVVDNVGLVHG